MKKLAITLGFCCIVGCDEPNVRVIPARATPVTCAVTIDSSRQEQRAEESMKAQKEAEEAAKRAKTSADAAKAQLDEMDRALAKIGARVDGIEQRVSNDDDDEDGSDEASRIAALRRDGNEIVVIMPTKNGVKALDTVTVNQ